MADNTTLDSGSGGDTIRTDEIAGVKWPVDKVAFGADGSATMVDGSGNGLPVLLKNSSGTELGTNAAPVQVGDAGGSLTVDGTVAATQSGTWTVQPGNTANTTAWKVDGSAVTQPVSAASLPLPSGASTAAKQPALGTAGTASADVITIQGVASMTPVAVSDNSGSLTVDGTVAATQSGTWTVTGTGGTFPVTDSGGSLTVDGTVTANLAAGTNNIGDVDVLTVPAPLSTTGGGTEATALRVTIANDSTGLVSVDDNGGSLTVDGTVAATQSGTWTVTGTGGTFPVTDSGGSLTVDGTVTANLAAGTNYAGKVRLTDGTTDTDIRDLTNSNALNVAIVDGSGDQITSFGGGTQYTEGDTDASITGTAMLWEDAGDTLRAVSASKPLPVSDAGGSLTVDGTVAVSGTVTVGSHAVTNAGTFAVQVDGTALTRLTDIETNTDSCAVVGNGAAATAQRVTLANDSTGIVALTTSTASIGKLAANSGVDIGDVDVTSVPAPLSTTGGGTEATALRVTIASDSTGVLSIDDNGGAITVDGTVGVSGTVAVTQSGTWDEVGINDSGNSITVDNGGTFAVQSADRNGVVLRPTITTSASPDYSANDVVSGIVTLSSVMSASGRQAVLKSLVVKDASGQAPALSFMFFRATPSGGTYTDNAALVWGTNDLANMTGVVRVLSTDWYTLVSKSLAAFGGLDQLMGSANSDLYMLIVADATWNAASTSDLTVELAFEQR